MKEKLLSLYNRITEKGSFHGIYAVGIVLLLTVCLILHAAIPDKSFSESEKRVLEPLPAVSAQSVFSGRFAEKLESYGADHFPGRDLLMQIRMQLELLLGRRESQGVWYADDQYLIERFDEPDEALTAKTLTALKDFAVRHEEIPMTFLLVPTQVNILADKLPSWAENADQNAWMDRLYAELDGLMRCPDLRPALRAAAKSGEQIYYRSDHHWTSAGVKAAYTAAAESLDVPAEEFAAAVVANRFSGSLSAKSGWKLPVYDTVSILQKEGEEIPYYVTDEESGENSISVYHPEALESADPYTFFFGGNYPLLKIETAVDTNRTLLVFKDSYANAFLPLLLDQFREIVIVDPRYYMYEADPLFFQYDFTEVLFLYNAGTLAEDTSLHKVLN